MKSIMALSRTLRFCRQHMRLLLYAHQSSRCSSTISGVSSRVKPKTGQHYSTTNDNPSYRNMIGQDLEETPVPNSVPDYGRLIEAWHFDVNSSGLLKFNSQMPVHIEALDPQTFPDVSLVFMNILFLGKNILSGKETIDMTKDYIVSVDLDEVNVDLGLTVDFKQNLKEIPNLQCHLQVPVKYNIDVSCQGRADVSLRSLESETINVHAEQGDCFLNNLKSNTVTVQSREGDIKSKSVVQGNITMTTGAQGCIETGRLQGQTIECQTENGHIKAKAIYGENCKIVTRSGTVLLTNCHGSTQIESETGDVSIGTMDGDLTASIKQGDVTMFLARDGSHEITSQSGNINLKLPSLNSDLELSGKQIDIGDVSIFRLEETKEKNFKKITGCLTENRKTESSLKVTTQEGNIELQSHSWLSSLNLNSNED